MVPLLNIVDQATTSIRTLAKDLRRLSAKLLHSENARQTLETQNAELSAQVLAQKQLEAQVEAKLTQALQLVTSSQSTGLETSPATELSESQDMPPLQLEHPNYIPLVTPYVSGLSNRGFADGSYVKVEDGHLMLGWKAVARVENEKAVIPYQVTKSDSGFCGAEYEDGSSFSCLAIADVEVLHREVLGGEDSVIGIRQEIWSQLAEQLPEVQLVREGSGRVWLKAECTAGGTGVAYLVVHVGESASIRVHALVGQ